MDISTSGVLAGVAIGLLSYIVFCWWKDPLRKIPGPTPLPLLGNALLIDPTHTHTQLYELAKQYGPVMKFTIFHKPFVVLNTLDVCLEAKLQRGDDFLGRATFPRLNAVLSTDLIFSDSNEPIHPVMRRLVTSGIRGYGPGMAQLENIIQEVLQDTVESLASQAGQTIQSDKICTNYVCSVIVYLLFGDRDSFDDSIFEFYRDMNQRLIEVCNPVSNHPILDIFPALMKLMPVFFNKTYVFLEETRALMQKHITKQITEAKESFDENNMRGCLDHFIKAQKEELDSEGNPVLDDEHIFGLMVNFFGAGMETSFASLSQAFLDFVHDKPLVKRIQAEIDANFESAQVIKYGDREKLPLLQAYIHENLRVLSQSPVMVPSCTLRDTEVGGYQIPAGTTILMNAFNTAHNPDIYPEPFECKPDRFLDDDGNVVPSGHPVRQNFVGFGVGQRHCPGESLARSRIFLFLAHILQKFDIEPVGQVPERDVRNYLMSIVVHPPPVDVKFILR